VDNQLNNSFKVLFSLSLNYFSPKMILVLKISVCICNRDNRRHIGRRPVVNFINILQRAFTSKDPKGVQNQLSCQYLFTLLGSAHKKAFCKMLMKLTLVVNFINILQAAFLSIFLHQKITNPIIKHYIKASQNTARKMLMKLTPGPA
jgi:hypothetical protein